MRKDTILVADNNASFLKTLVEILESHDYRVLQAANPTEAEKQLKGGAADLAILDIRLVNDEDPKDFSGLFLARDLARSMPKILITNYPDSKQAIAALKPQLDGLPSAVEFVPKQDGTDAILEAIKLALGPDLLWMRSVRNALSGTDAELALDYKYAQKQAQSNFMWGLVFAVTGTLVFFAGVGLAIWQTLPVGIISALSGLVTQIVSVLFYQRVDKANSRMDTYHRERIEGQRFEILLKACDGLDTSGERAACRKEIIMAAADNWLKGQRRRSTTAKQDPAD